MAAPPSYRSLGALRAAGLGLRSLREELRANLLERLRKGQALFPGIRDFEDTVIPAVENALLCGHDLIFLGERGQAKTRMIRGLAGLLDEWIPEVAGSEIHDDPFAPVSAAALSRAIRPSRPSPRRSFPARTSGRSGRWPGSS